MAEGDFLPQEVALNDINENFSRKQKLTGDGVAVLQLYCFRSVFNHFSG